MKKDVVMLTLGRIAQAIISIVTIRLLTTVLDKNEVGYTYLLTTIAAYFSLVFINPIGMYFNRNIHGLQKQGELKSFLSVLNKYFFLVGIIAIPLLWLIQNVLLIASQISFFKLAALVFLIIYAATWFQTLCPALNMLEKRKHFILINVGSILVGLALSVTGVMLFEKSAFFWLLGNVLGQAVGAVMSLYFVKNIFLKHQIKNLFNMGRLFKKEVLYFCLPVAVATLLMWFQSQSYRVVVERFVGAEVLASIGVGLGIAASISAVMESIVTQYYYPQYYSVISSANETLRVRAWNSLFKNAAVFYILTAATIIFCSRPLLNILVSPQYRELSRVVVIGVVIELFRVLTNIVYAVSHSELKTKASVLPYAIAGSISFGGSIIVALLYPDQTNNYIPLVLAFGSFLCLVIMILKMKTLLPLKLSGGRMLQIMVISMPLLIGYFYTKDIGSVLPSLGVLLLGGLYFVSALWFLRSGFDEIKLS